MRVLGLIPARSGSQGVPGKNLRLLGGRPLIAHSIESALAAQLDQVWVSTDSEAIAEVARGVGAEVPFTRPAELATDTTPMSEVVVHATAFSVAQGLEFDAFCLLQPTAPFRSTALIRRSLEMLESAGTDSVVTVRRIPVEHHPSWAYFADEAGRLSLALGERVPIARRQDLPPAYYRDGGVYLARWHVARRGSLYGASIAKCDNDEPDWVNIDTEEDWLRAERIVEGRSGRGEARSSP